MLAKALVQTHEPIKELTPEISCDQGNVSVIVFFLPTSAKLKQDIYFETRVSAHRFAAEYHKVRMTPDLVILVTVHL